MSYKETGIHTCACGLETINEDGVCLICKAKRSQARNKKLDRPVKPDDDNSFSSFPDLIGESREFNGGDGMKEFSAGHRPCEIEGCEKYVARERKCLRHYNEAHGIVKQRGHRPRKQIAAPSARNDKSKKATPSPHPSPSRGEGEGGGGIIDKLKAERDRIDAAIDVIKQYA